MSRQSDLSVPKSGVSRFSKALPGVPGFDGFDDDDDDSESNAVNSNNNRNRKNSELSLPARTSSLASPPTKNLPLPPLPPAPPIKTLPTTPQPSWASKDSLNKNINSNTSSYDNTSSQISIAAPSLSPTSSVSVSLQSPPLSGRSMMSIPRKPIANLQLPAPTTQFLAQPSPTFSLSSILMAYMEDGDESQQSSAGEKGENGQEVAASGSEKVDAAPARAPAATVTGGSGSLPARPNAGFGHSQRPAERTLPPPPPKDDKPTPPRPDSPELTAPSSPRPEIWKRRPHMSQASRELPGLKLDYSHGSTADTQLPPDAAEPETASEAASDTAKAAAQRAPPFAGGLPGRNIRPSLPAKDQPPPATQAMGSETSKLKQIKERLGSQRSESISSTSSAKAGFPGVPAAKRPPTPEYQKEEVKVPAVEPFVSPVSPASSPEAPRGASPDFSKGLPPKPSNGNLTATASSQKPISRKALPTSPSQDFTAVKDSFRPPSDANSTSASSQAAVPSTLPKAGATLTTTTAPVASLPKDDASTGSRGSGDTTVVQPQPQPQPAVIRADAPQTVKPQRSEPQATADPRLLQSETQGLLYRGRDGTLYAEMKTQGEPHPKAAYFPTQTYPNLPRDGIIKARPLTDMHFNCFQQHRTMARRSNRNCPLTCQTCDRADVEDRWVCAFCHLRICDGCYRKLGSYQRDLRRLVDVLASAGPAGFTSASRPGTAMGL
ncbi:hypothetical protein CFAM422_005988 [Trichoderma lentiforme]|uniref:Uncharacterized protein n=1 Tax=Trichoderma lentiforme TaxID=1567552 RepID=A0A9P4XG95_9HYPO|nr:hypothetical protein CFAM422_005988 [Trichoderma lentiforme]